ncbi:MAG: PD40 domain-containing protein [Chitinivibrionales bacterium]|nr:PD40 domain-containing protein [Chitinivibrionales bacterium]
MRSHKKNIVDCFSGDFRHLIILMVLCSVCLCFGFGQNKVQYNKLSWHYHEIPHFKIYFHQNTDDLPMLTALWADVQYRELSQKFGFVHERPIPLIVFGSPILFEQTNVIPDIISEGVGGFTESIKNRVVVPFTGSYEEFRHVINHEMVHAFQYGIMFDQFGGSLFQSNAIQLPLWFAEGSAEFLSSGWDVDADMFLMDRTIFGTVPLPGPEMNDYMVYKGGQSFLFFLYTSRGKAAFDNFLKEFRRTKLVVESLEKIYKYSLTDLGMEWHQEIKRIYWPELGKREELNKKANAVTSHALSHSNFNLAPRISPNGTMIAFYTDLNDYTEIAVTDNEGTIIQRIGQHSSGGYFESFQPFRSGLCWSPKSDQIAFVTKNQGRNEIRLVNIKTKKLTNTFVPANFSSITDPDWSPNGKFIVFSGLRHARTDLYCLELESEKVTQLTNDAACESSPRFSRDGAAILFSVIDTSTSAIASAPRPSSDLGLIDLATNKIERLSSTPSENERYGCFSPDGNSIAFVSDRNGINNIYLSPVHNPDSAKALTNIVGGCSQIDWSKEKNSLVFCLFQRSGWDIWSIDNPAKKTIDTALATTAWIQSLKDTLHPLFLANSIPSDTSDSTASAQLKNNKKKRAASRDISSDLAPQPRGSIEEFAIPRDTTKQQQPFIDSLSVSADKQIVAATDSSSDSTHVKIAHDSLATALRTMKPSAYKTEFTLDAVSFGAAFNTMYGGLAGQGIVVLSDLLGNQQIAFAANMQGSLEENNFFLSYLNSQHRLASGAAGFFERYYTQTSDYLAYHDTKYGAQLLVRYPFSLVSRIDGSLFTQRIDRQPYIWNGKAEKWESTDSLPSVSLNFFQPSLSVAYDDILWGITGPINGTRASTMAIVAPALQAHDAAFFSLDCDVRNYTHVNRRFVWANKVAFGFSQSLDDRPSQRRYFLGGNENALLFDINQEIYNKNLPLLFYSDWILPFRGWDYFDFSGTRYAVFNSEFRFPLIKTIDLVWPLPIVLRYINGAIFIDMGNAWDPQDEQTTLPLPKNIYGGVGYGLRTNLGIFVLRYDIAWQTNWRRYLRNAHHYVSIGTEY